MNFTDSQYSHIRLALTDRITKLLKLGLVNDALEVYAIYLAFRGYLTIKDLVPLQRS